MKIANKLKKIFMKRNITSNSVTLFFSAIGLSFTAIACTQAPPKAESSISATPTAMMMDHGSMNHPQMDLGPADEDYELRFIDSMIPHHEGAVIMANDALSKSKRPEIKTLANAILKAQPSEIKQMQSWRSLWYPKAPTTSMMWNGSMNHPMPMTGEQMSSMRMSMDLGPSDAGYDDRFLAAMIPHHESAVIMAKDLALKSKRPEMQKLAKEIIASQQAEIDQMNHWRKLWATPQK